MNMGSVMLLAGEVPYAISQFNVYTKDKVRLSGICITASKHVECVVKLERR